MDTVSNNPLQWPMGWPRTPSPKPSKFSADRTMAQARDFLLAELRRLGALRIEISSNVQTLPSGLPRSGQGQPADRGVAVYFQLEGQQYVFASDKWSRVQDNLYAIALHVEATRAQERYGVGKREQAFRGYLLPAAAASSRRPWWEVLGVPETAGHGEIRQAFHQHARVAHADMGGSDAKMAELVAARDEALRARTSA